MERVELFETNKVNHCTIFSVLRRLTFDFMIDTMFRRGMTLIVEVVYNIAHSCHKLIYGVS